MVEPHVHHDVQPKSCVRCNRLPQRGVQRGNRRGDGVMRLPRPQPIPGCKAGGVIARATSTPMLTHTPGNVFWIAAAMDDFPERGAPLRITIWPDEELTLTTTNLTRKRRRLEGH
jgi:hypothetical protein